MFRSHFIKSLITGILVSVTSLGHAQTGWVQKANFGGVARTDPGAFVIGNYAYMGAGYDGSYLTDFWRYDPSTNTWTSIASYPGTGMYSPTSFSYNGKGYCANGYNAGKCFTDVWCYDPGTNTWSAKAKFPGTPRYDAPCFLIGHNVYVICGSAGGPPYLQDVWMYDINADTWTQKNNFPGGKLSGMLAFAIGNHGYAGAGWDGGNMHNVMWEYDTTSDSWTTIAPIPVRGAGLSGLPHGFLLGSKEYVCTGLDATWKAMPTGWAYDTITKAWCPFSHEGPIARSYGMAFTLNNKGYMGVGADTTGVWSGPFVDDFWEYDPQSSFAVTDTNMCSNKAALFSGITSFDSTVSPITWNWTFTGGNPSTSTSQYPTVNYSAGGNYNVQLIVSTCAGIDTVVRTVNMVSGSSLAITLSGNASICSGQSDTLTASGGTFYVWNTGATTSTIVVTPGSNTTYSVQVSQSGCPKDTTITVSVGPKLPVVISGSNSVCQGNSIALSASGGKSYSYLWNTGASTSSIIITPAATTTYSVQVSNGSCAGDTTINVTVNPAPNLKLSITNNSLCQGDTSTLTASGGNTYIWNNGSTGSSITVTPTTTTTYSVITSNGTCTKDTSVVVTVNKKPVAAVTGGQTVCEGTDVTLTASGGQEYKWIPATGLNCTTCAIVKASPTTNITYTLVALNGMCSDTASAKITVTPVPSVTVCCSDTIQMGDTVTLSVTGKGVNNYEWAPSSSLSCSTCSDTKAYPQFSTTYAITMNDSGGCRVTDSVRIVVDGCSNVWIPNAFSPNGDGLNDVFAPKGICMVSYNMYIFDRWGNLLYYNNNSKPWNGRILNGSIVQQDTYVYSITITDGFRKQHTYLGKVTLVK